MSEAVLRGSLIPAFQLSHLLGGCSVARPLPGGSWLKASFCAPCPGPLGLETVFFSIRWKLRMQVLSADMPGIFLKIIRISKPFLSKKTEGEAEVQVWWVCTCGCLCGGASICTCMTEGGQSWMAFLRNLHTLVSFFKRLIYLSVV